MLKRRFLNILLGAAMLLALLSVTALAEQTDASWYAGHESDTEYTLTTAAQLAGLAQLCNADYAASPFAGKTVKLGASIDLTGYNWTPIWWNAGTFDGQGFAITGMNVTEGVAHNIFTSNDIFGGLFAYADNGAKLCNFTVSGSVELDYESQFIVLYAGGVVGYNANCAIINVGSNVDVETISDNDCYSGGIAGYTWLLYDSFGNCILNSYANGEISAQSADNRNHNAGGIAGISENSTIVNCYYGGTSVTGKKAAGITYNANDNNVANCYSNFTGSTQFGSIIDGTRYTDAADLLTKLNDSTVLADIQTNHHVTPLRWKMVTGGMPVLAFQPDEQFTLAPGGTYWFDLSGETIPGTVNAALPDGTLHYVPFTYAGTVDAYALKEASSDVEGSSEQAAIAADPNAQYGYRYDHSLFISDYNVTHTVSRRELVAQSLIFGKAYESGGVSYTLRAPSEGSNATFVDGEVTNVTPQSNEWDTVLRKNIEIKNFQNIFSRGQDTHKSSFFVSRGSRSARHFSATTIDVKWESTGFRPVLEVPGGLANDGLKAVALNLNGGGVGVEGSISIIVNNGAAFTAPGSDGLTRPAGDSGAYFQWKDGSGNLYSPGENVPADVTALTAVWTPDAKPASSDAGVAAVSVSGAAGSINGAAISVVLPYGTAIPGDPGAVSITPAAGAAVSALHTTDGGATWTFTVTAEDGLTTAHYAIYVTTAPGLSAESGSYSSGGDSYGGWGAAQPGKTATLLEEPPSPHTVKIAPSSTEGGSVTGGGDYADGDYVTLTAEANAGWHFVEWTENGAHVSSSASYSFPADQSRELTAVFEKDAAPSPQNNSITCALPEQSFTLGGDVTFTASGAGMDNAFPAEGDMRWLPVSWHVNPSGDFSDGFTQSFTTAGMAPGTHTLTVTFSLQRFDGLEWTDATPAVTDTQSMRFTLSAAAPLSGPEVPLTGERSVPKAMGLLMLAAGAGVAGVALTLKKRL